jgi:hypothetical protein
MTEDAFLQALAALEEVIAENESRTTQIRKRMGKIRKARSQGLPYSDSVADEDGPLIVQLLTERSRNTSASRGSACRPCYEGVADRPESCAGCGRAPPQPNHR